MEWWPQEPGVDQAGRGSSSDVTYKSSRISTGGHKARGAGVIIDNTGMHVSLMDEMYKMSPFNAHPSAELTKGPVAGNGPSEERGRTGYGDSNGGTRGEVAAGGASGVGATNQLINVRVKKHETEQQTEARMRSYAYFLEQDGEDEWRYANNKSNRSYKSKRSELEKSWLAAAQPANLIRQEPADGPTITICEDPREVFLDQILAKGNPEKKRRLLASGQHASTIQAALEVKREKATHVGKPHEPDATLDQNGRIQLLSIMEQIFEEHRVVSRERIFAILLKTDISSKLHKMASAYDQARSSNEDLRAKIDRQLHDWLKDACRDKIKHIQLRNDGMERYVWELDGSGGDDPMRTIILDVIQQVDARHVDSGKANAGAVRKEDVRSACEGAKYRFSDTQYNKIMKEYCVGNKGNWWMKSGNEERDSA